MNCRYCYIIKNPELLNIHNDIIRLIKDGTLIKNLYDLFGEELTYITIWGTEPTLTLPVIEDKLEYIINLFPKLKNINFSSNMLANTNTIHNFVKKVNELISNKPEREFDIDIQISIDGPKEITDLNRKENSTNIIVSNILELVKFLSSIEISNNLNINLRFKPTMSTDNIDFFLNQNGTEKYFDFFEDLLKNMYMTLDNKKNVRLPHICTLTLMVPGMYTVEDGKLYSKFIEVLCKKEIEDLLNKRYKFIKYRYVSYITELEDFLYNLKQYHYKANQNTCCAGDSSIGGDQLGNIHMCHSSYNLVNDKYLKSVYEDPKNKDYDVISYDAIRMKYIRDNYVVDSHNDYEVSRIMTVYRGFHDFSEMRVSYVRNLIKELALANQIDKEFLYDKKLTELFAYFMTSKFNCPYNNLASTSVIHCMGTSLIKIFGNGAFQNMIKYFNIFKEMGY